MYKLIREYFCNGEQDSEIIAENEKRNVLEDLFEEELQKDEDFGYVVDNEYNKKYCIRLFLGKQENWDDYIEMYIVEHITDTENEIEKKLKDLAKNYDEMTYSDFTGCLMAMETMYNIDFEDLYNKVAEKIIFNRIKNFKGKRVISNYNFISFIKSLEKEFEVEIDLFDLSIKK